MGFRWYQIIIFAGMIIALALLVLPPQREEGILLARSGKGLEADKLLREIIAKNPQDAAASLELAEGLMKEGESQRAQEVLQNFVQKNPDHDKYREKIARIYESGYFFEQAINTLAAQPAKYRDKLVSLCVQAGMLDRAIAFLKQGLSGNSADLKSWKDIEQLQQWNLDIKSAGESLEKVAALKPDAENIYAVLNFYFWRTDPDKMRLYARQLAKVEKLDLDQLRLLRVTWVYLRDLPQAIDAAQKVCAEIKSNETDWADYGALLSWSGDFTKALEVAGKATDKFPKSTILLWQELAFARKLDKMRLVAELNLRMSKLIDDSNLIREAADIYDRLGDNDKAIALYHQLEKSRNKQALDTLRLAQLYLDGNKQQEAAAYSQELFQRLRSGEGAGEADEELLANAAELMGKLGKTEEQKSLLEELGRKGSYESSLLLAEIYANAGDRLKALQALANIPKDAPGDIRRRAAVSAAFLLSDEAFDENKVEAARKQSEKLAIEAINYALGMAESYPPEEPGVQSDLRRDIESLRGSLFYLYMAEDNVALAQKILEKIEAPTSSQILYLAAALADAGDKGSTEHWLAKLTQPEKLEAGQLGQLGDIYLLLEKNELALKTLLEADKKSAGADKTIRLSLARAYGATGNWQEQYKIVDHYASLPEATEDDWITAADARAQQEDMPAEENVLAAGSVRFPESAMLLARRVNLLAAMGYRQQAKNIAWGLSGMRLKKDINGLIIVFYAMLDVNQNREAGRILQLAIETDAKGPQVILAQARYAAAENKLREALVLYKQYLQKEKNDPAGWFELAQVRRDMGIWGDRQAALKARGYLNLKQVNDWTLEAGIANFLGQSKRALFASARAKSLQSTVPARYFDMAVLYNEHQLPMYAEEEENKGLSLNPAYNELQRQRAVSSIQQRKFSKGIAELKELLQQEDNPQTIAELNTEIGYAQAEKGDWKESAKNFKKAAEILQATPQQTAYGARAEIMVMPLETTMPTEDAK